MYFFYYTCDIIGNNSQTITCMRAQAWRQMIRSVSLEHGQSDAVSQDCDSRV